MQEYMRRPQRIRRPRASEVRGFAKRLGRMPVLKINLSVDAEGEVVALIGGNSAGKIDAQ